MFDRIELIKALNSILELMFDEFCQVCSRLVIYRKLRKNSLSAQFSVERYIVFIIISLTDRFHHQIVFIKSFSSSRFHQSRHYQIVVIIKQCSSSNQSIKSIYQVNLSSQSIKSIYQVNLSSQFIKSIYQVNLLSQSIKSVYQDNLSSQSIKSIYQVILSSHFIKS
jgi:hypothetical protein